MPGVVITSGHQPGFHHPGILAKRFALDSAATPASGDALWLVADQDIDDPEVIRYPDLDEEGRLVARSWRLLPSRRGMPTALRPWGTTTPPPRISTDLPTSIQDGLDAMHGALESVEGTTVAERFTAANEQLLAGMLQCRVSQVRASELLETDSGRAAVQRILEQPNECAAIWNQALELAPRSARSLKIHRSDPDQTEVPAWVIDDQNQRRPAIARDLRPPHGGGPRIMPRAFLMTAVFRSLSEAPMIHGIGGGRYEVVTEHWARAFLGLDLPPIQVVTCDLRLPLDPFVEPTEHPGVREAIRSLEHDPWSSPETKQAWIDRIRQAPPGSTERRSLFSRMHQAMNEERGSVAEELERMRAIQSRQADRVRREEIALDRTWPWPLHDRAVLLDCMRGLS